MKSFSGIVAWYSADHERGYAFTVQDLHSRQEEADIRIPLPLPNAARSGYSTLIVVPCQKIQMSLNLCVIQALNSVVNFQVWNKKKS